MKTASVLYLPDKAAEILDYRRWELAALVAAGHIKRRGANRAAYYRETDLERFRSRRDSDLVFAADAMLTLVAFAVKNMSNI